MKGKFTTLPAALLLLAACSNSETASGPSPKEAAESVRQAYATTDPVLQKAVSTFSESMNKGDFEQAVISFATIRAKPADTPEQQQAIIQSAQAIEVNLINRMNAGDENAKRAYQLMKELKRN